MREARTTVVARSATTSVMEPLVMLVTLLMVMAVSVQGQHQSRMDGLGAAPDRYCLACLCHASTGCDLHSGCTGQEASAFCGPFHMSQPYWQDANITAVEKFGSYDFRRCATDVECAAEVVTSYMTKFSRDCDEDGRVTCRDYGLMHFLGYTGCQNPSGRRRAASSGFHDAFIQCLSKMDDLLSAGMMQNYIPGCQTHSS